MIRILNQFLKSNEIQQQEKHKTKFNDNSSKTVPAVNKKKEKHKGTSIKIMT